GRAESADGRGPAHYRGHHGRIEHRSEEADRSHRALPRHEVHGEARPSCAAAVLRRTMEGTEALREERLELRIIGQSRIPPAELPGPQPMYGINRFMKPLYFQCLASSASSASSSSFSSYSVWRECGIFWIGTVHPLRFSA